MIITGILALNKNILLKVFHNFTGKIYYIKVRFLRSTTVLYTISLLCDSKVIYLPVIFAVNLRQISKNIYITTYIKCMNDTYLNYVKYT